MFTAKDVKELREKTGCGMTAKKRLPSLTAIWKKLWSF